MPQALKHNLNVTGSADDAARMEFVSGLRSFILNDVAASLKARYTENIEPRLKNEGRVPESGEEVHKALKSDTTFRCYSSLRYNAQEMVWRSVLRPLMNARPTINRSIEELESTSNHRADLILDASLEIPKNVSALDVHLAPGSYIREDPEAPWMAGAVYDHGLNVFSFGLMGRNLDDIGQSMSQYIHHRYPSFDPEQILDLGCTIGHNTCAWKQVFPRATVTGIDVAAPCLRYAHARAMSQGHEVNFRQMNATALDIEDSSVDVVFSSMFLHELPVKDIKKVMSEAYRVLRPGGLMLHMELPPNSSLSPFDAFYLDWDAYYNNEPFYKSFRDQDFRQLRVEAGFSEADLFEFTTPQYSYMDPDEYARSVSAGAKFDSNTGRLAKGIQWFGFGAWK